MYRKILHASQRIMMFSNLLGSFLCFLYYLYFVPMLLPQVAPQQRWLPPLLVTLGILGMVTGVSRLLFHRWTVPIRRGVQAHEQTDSSSAAIPASIRVRLVRAPWVVAGGIFLSWLLCGFVTAVILTFLTPLDIFGCLWVFFGQMLVIGAAIGLFAFLILEQRIRRVFPTLFPQGLSPQAHRSLTVRQRLLAGLLLVSLLPLVLLGSVLYQQDRYLAQTADPSAPVSPLFFVLFLLGVGTFLSFALAFAVAKSIVDPLHTLQAAMTHLSRGRLATRVPVVSTDELGVVSQGFNMMAAELQATYRALETEQRKLTAALQRIHLLEQAKRVLRNFVPRTVHRLIEEDPAALPTTKTEKDVSVLFLDIADYARLSEALDRETVNCLIETYFSSYVDAIYAQGGDINETAGDGLMILFQQDDPAEHAAAAVRTAVAIVEQTAAINRCWQETTPVTVKIGINSGPALVGITKFQGGAGTRWTYTASGPTTNIAARLANLAHGGEILVGEETARRLGERFCLQSRGKQRLKNVGTPLLVSQVCAWHHGAIDPSSNQSIGKEKTVMRLQGYGKE